MKVFVAGATGALGKQLVPMLVAKGHDVVGMTRTEAKRNQLRSLGARPVVADALDADAVGRAVGKAEPDVIVHQLTAIPPAINMRRFDREFALTNRLRIEGTDHLLSAGHAAGVKRFVAQSNAGVPYARTGDWIKREPEYRTEIALDLGRVFELYPSARTVIRMELGDTIIRHRSIAPPCFGTSCTSNNLASRFGVGLRF